MSPQLEVPPGSYSLYRFAMVCRHSRPLMLVLVLALPVSGCGSSESPTGPTAPTPAPQPVAVPSLGNPVLEQMLSTLPTHIEASLRSNEQAQAGSPGTAAPQREAKIAVLRRPTIANEIISGRFFDARTAPSADGGVMLAAVFLQDGMRSEVSTALEQLATALPILEGFMGRPFPHEAVRIWYGFAIGSRGGGGNMFAEDCTTYTSRTGAMRVPCDAILYHELAHSYILHEGLTQFIELYVTNVIGTGSPDPSRWTYVRTDVGVPPASTASSAALVEIYSLIGRDAMTRAYGAISQLNTAAGEPLSLAGKQAFIDHAPPHVRAQVTELVERIVF